MNDETLTIGTQRGESSPGTPASILALTIQWHPDLDRVGEVAPLDQTTTGLNRDLPLFAQLGDFATGRGLADRFVSRSDALQVRRTPDGGAELSIEGGHSVEVQGRRLDEGRAVFRREQLVDGVVVTLRGRIALCLHLMRWPARTTTVTGMLGNSDRIEDVRQQVVQLANTDAPVLLRGRTGSGKEVAASGLAAAGRRASRPFIKVNMGAVPPSTAIAALFGYAKGSFSGADRDHAGYFGAADGGTLFLDEIGFTPLDVQGALLRALDAGTIQPLGHTRERKVDVRLICATDADLEDALQKRTFQEALLYRLKHTIDLPPLASRRVDIGPLFLHLVKRHLKAHGGDRLDQGSPTGSAEPWIPASFVSELLLAPWPGNVRQLDSVAEALAIENQGNVGGVKLERARRHLVSVAAGPSATSPAGLSLPSRKTAERRTQDQPRVYPGHHTAESVYLALEQHGWELHPAATSLGLSPTTLNKLRSWDPRIREAKSLTREEVQTVHARCAGNLDEMAASLRVSKRALQLALARLLPPTE